MAHSRASINSIHGKEQVETRWNIQLALFPQASCSGLITGDVEVSKTQRLSCKNPSPGCFIYKGKMISPQENEALSQKGNWVFDRKGKIIRRMQVAGGQGLREGRVETA